MLTKEQIKFLDLLCPNRWDEENGEINVDGLVDMRNMNLKELPVQFKHVNGDFYCGWNQLTTLLNCPYIIHGQFSCQENKLTSLEGGPKQVNGYYICSYNQLTNVIGAPEICNDFWCSHNQLTSLEGCPRIIKNDLNCSNNPDLKYLWGIRRVTRNVFYDNENEINEWIISSARKDIIFPHFTLEENINWIKHEHKYSCLLDAPDEIRKYFSPRIMQLVDSGVYNESRILDYKKFKKLC